MSEYFFCMKNVTYIDYFIFTNNFPSSVDGRLSVWGQWSQCSGTCEGLRKRTRTCRPPKHGGSPCNGNTVHMENCGALHCPGD
jgi:angiogenesis inhibitor 2